MAYENRDYTHLTESEKKNINLLAEAIRNKAYGIDVRESIALAIELMLDIFSKENNDAVAEIIKARNEFGSLDERLDSMLADMQNISVSQINKNLGKIDQTYLTDELIAQIAGTAEINAVPADESITTAKLANDAVTTDKISDIKFRGNLYKYPEHFKLNKQVKTDGVYRDLAEWGAALVPIDTTESMTYSILLPFNDYSGSIGAIGFLNSTLSTVGFSYSTPIAGNFNGINYINVTVPQTTKYIGVTVVRPTSATIPFDNRENLIVVKGNVINDYTIAGEIDELFGLSFVDNVARSMIEGSRAYTGIKWTVFGDSLSAENDYTSMHYFDYISDDLGFEIINMGVGGTGYKRSDTNNTAFYQRISSVPLDTDVITIFGSLNDLGTGVPIGTSSDTGTDTIGGAINTTLDNLNTRLPVVPVGIISPTPWQTSKPWDDSNSATQYAKLLKDICEDRGLLFLDLYHNSGLRPWDANYRTLMYSRDNGNGTHPDDNGHKLFYPQVREFVKKLI